MILIPSDAKVSAPFKVPENEQWTIYASGLSGTDTVTFELIDTTAAGPGGDVCCPGPVSMPSINWRAPLMTTCGCDPATRVQLTATMPYVVLDRPREIPMLATVNAPDHAVITVYANKTGYGSNGLCC